MLPILGAKDSGPMPGHNWLQAVDDNVKTYFYAMRVTGGWIRFEIPQAKVTEVRLRSRRSSSR